MGKKRASAVSAAAAPVFPFPEAAGAGEPDHFSDYGFDPQLVGFFTQPEAKRPLWSRRHQPPLLESARFKLQKPISKRHHHQHLQKQRQQRRRRWWSSAASAALLLFRRPCSSSSTTSSPATAAAPAPPPYGSAASASVPLYLADDDCDAGADDVAAACACWAPAVLSGRLAAAELGSSAAVVPYVSLRSAGLGSGGAAGGADGGGAPAMPIYLVT